MNDIEDHKIPEGYTAAPGFYYVRLVWDDGEVEFTRAQYTDGAWLLYAKCPNGEHEYMSTVPRFTITHARRDWECQPYHLTLDGNNIFPEADLDLYLLLSKLKKEGKKDEIDKLIEDVGEHIKHELRRQVDIECWYEGNTFVRDTYPDMTEMEKLKARMEVKLKEHQRAAKCLKEAIKETEERLNK